MIAIGEASMLVNFNFPKGSPPKECLLKYFGVKVQSLVSLFMRSWEGHREKFNKNAMSTNK